ncbi:MAG: glycosyltransferase [Prevotella sp.]|nr:glycosyltransferase [Prevotella sp.]
MYSYSFIIPHKNTPHLLQRCVDSIPERDDVQVIVVDDNSDEGKKPSLKEHKNLQVILLDATLSKGAGRARNVGLKHAEGKWLLFPDSDDYYRSEVLDVLDKYKAKEIDVLYFNFEYRHGITNEILPALYFNKYFIEYDESAEAVNKLKFHHNVPWTKMVSHEYIRKNKITFEETPNGNDILFSLLVGFYSTHIEVSKRILYVYNKNVDSLLTKKKNKEEVLCKLTHYIQHNNVYSYIGHSEWKISSLKFLLHQISNGSFVENIRLLLFIICKFPEIHRKKNEWVTILKKKNR